MSRAGGLAGDAVTAAASGVAAGERMAWAIFIALAAHGLLILGLGFVPDNAAGPEQVPTLEVTLLDSPSPDEVAPDDARYLAQASQEGAGNVAEQIRPEFFERPPAPETAEDQELGEDSERMPPTPETEAAERITSWAGPLQAVIAPLPTEPEARPATAPPEGGLNRVTASNPREHFISVDARESVFAEYLAGWKARMERLGTLNFPAAAAGKRQGDPVLEIAVGADGRLAEVRVTRSSGHSGLDQAAIDLVRLASPYDPFPAAVAAQFDVLRFSYEWRFRDGRAGAGVLRAPER